MSTCFEVEIDSCSGQSAVLTSKSWLGQHVYDEYWHIRPPTDDPRHLTLYFDKFDIGCDFGIYFVIGETRYCNTNKPLGNLSAGVFYIELHITRKDYSLVDGFSARYEIYRYTFQGYKDFDINTSKLSLYI